MKHLTDLSDLTVDEILSILAHAHELKAQRPSLGKDALRDKTIAMIFSKSSTRTRVSFEVGIRELGGNSLFLGAKDLQLGRGETMDDTAQVLSRYVHGVVIRTHAHEELTQFASVSSVPIINALTDRYHPCQLLADLLTMQQRFGTLEGHKVAYLGDGASNMARSWALAALMTGIELVICAPEGYQLDLTDLPEVPQNGRVSLTDDPSAAVAGASVLYTDVWVSMGFEEEKQERLQALAPYQVTDALMSQARSDACFLHCLPAHRGEEVSAEVIDGKQSYIWDQAENRLHAQKAVLAHLVR